MQEVRIIKSEKAIMRAIASTIVNNKKKVISLVNKYSVINSDISTEDLKNVVLNLILEKKDFAEKFINLMIKTGNLKNVTGVNRNVVGAIAGIISGVVGVAGKIAGSNEAKLQGRNLERQAQIDAENQMAQMIAAEQEAKAKKEQANTIMIIVGLVAVFSIFGIIIYNKTK